MSNMPVNYPSKEDIKKIRFVESKFNVKQMVNLTAYVCEILHHLRVMEVELVYRRSQKNLSLPRMTRKEFGDILDVMSYNFPAVRSKDGKYFYLHTWPVESRTKKEVSVIVETGSSCLRS